MLKTKILLPLLITFSSLFGASKFLVSNPNLNSSFPFQSPQTKPKNTLKEQSLSTISPLNPEITTFEDDEDNKFTISIEEKSTESIYTTSFSSDEITIFSTPSEKYLGYYLKKYFNVTPLFFINLPSDKQQLYKEYIDEHPDKEYLQTNEQELFLESSNPSLFKNDVVSIKSTFFKLE